MHTTLKRRFNLQSKRYKSLTKSPKNLNCLYRMLKVFIGKLKTQTRVANQPFFYRSKTSEKLFKEIKTWFLFAWFSIDVFFSETFFLLFKVWIFVIVRFWMNEWITHGFSLAIRSAEIFQSWTTFYILMKETPNLYPSYI